jgi:hypothetical protein
MDLLYTEGGTLHPSAPYVLSILPEAEAGPAVARTAVAEGVMIHTWF